ncbi:seipin [Trichonephila clavata]|uniref:Seipin n=1 Tax=Trichonephila clavata TaxID=2740835 RepID=A0A8X6HAB9_TRICU|nr:seipin [Trichonephila clavata]
MDFISDLKRIFFKALLLIFAFFTVLWFSIASYALLYYLYIPAVAHVKPVHLKYDTSCTKGTTCSFPYDNLTLVEKGHYELLAGGQVYSIEIVLDMPESDRNLNQGMFMIRLDMVSQQGEVLKSSRRPAILHYRSPLFKVIYTLFFVPALLAGTLEEKQSLSIPLFEKYVEDCTHPAYFAYVAIEAEIAEVYSCTLRIHAQFTGLRYMMYYWPMLSAVVGIGMNFFMISIMFTFIWVRQIMNSSQYNNLPLLSEEEQNLIKEIRESAQRSPSRSRSQAQTTDILKLKDRPSIAEFDEEDIETLSSHPRSQLLGSVPYKLRGDPSGTSLGRDSFLSLYPSLASGNSGMNTEAKSTETEQNLSENIIDEGSSGDSEFSICSQEEEEFSDAIDKVVNIEQLPELPQESPELRRRNIIAE